MFRKKIRCNGEQPCQHCTGNGILCEYKFPYARGKRRHDGGSNTRDSPLSLPWGGAHQSMHPRASEPLPPEGTETVKNSPEPGESDKNGHFVGPASGLAFVLRLQRRLQNSSHPLPSNAIFTLGDPALPEFDESSFMLPSREEADQLLATYFGVATPTICFFHRGTVEGWLNDLYQGSALEKSSHAAILIILAHATRYIDPSTASEGTNASGGFVIATNLPTNSKH